MKRGGYMYWSDKFNSIMIIEWILLSAKDPYTIDIYTLIDNAMAYGRAYGVTEEQIQRALMTRLEDMLINKTP